MSSDAVIKRMTEHFSLISNFSAAARITAVDYSREVLLFGGICESKQVTNSGSRYKTTLSLQNDIFFSIVPLKKVLKPKDDTL